MDILILALLIQGARGFIDFQSKIPNGDKVPHPCPQNSGGVWPGVGHQIAGGTGDLNPFGQDFHNNNFAWDECLCRYDSDGDGRTNGEELGDPQCTWRQGEILSTTEQELSHPGVCEPVDAVKCRQKNEWLECTRDAEQRCAAFDEPDTRRLELVIPRAQVPARGTSEVCTAFTLPAGVREGDFHIVGVEPIIDNVNIMHHMFVFGCEDHIVDHVQELYNSTRRCGMIAGYCPNLVFLWAYGLDSECYGDQYGYRIGVHGYKVLVLEFHWNNPQRRADQWDASGVTLYYTPNLRQHDAHNFFVGPQYLQIPPLQDRWEEVGYCSNGCTQNMFSSNVYISKIGPHMHTLGRELKVELLDAAGGVTLLVNHTTYDYNNPKWFWFDPPVAINGSNSLRVTCTFDSSHKPDWTFYGADTEAEMCLAAVEYFPRQPLDTVDCFSFGPDIAFCHGGYGQELYAECAQYANDPGNQEDLAALYESLLQSCDPTGYSCNAGCAEAIQAAKENPCLHDDVIMWAKWHVFGRMFPDKRDAIRMLASCDGLSFTSHHHHDDANQPSLQEWCARNPPPSSSLSPPSTAAIPQPSAVVCTCAVLFLLSGSLVHLL